MLIIKREKMGEILPELMQLLKIHHQELCVDPQKMPLKPDWAIYLTRERIGELMLMVAREDGEIVAYYIGFLSGMLHYSTVKSNHEDIFYTRPDQRDGTVAVRLFDAVKRENKNIGVKFWRTTAKIGTAAPRFLERMGFKKYEESFFMWMGD